MEPSRAIPQKILQMARSVDILLISLDEATALTGARDPFQAFAALRQADALIVSGKFAGNAPDVEKVREAKRLVTRPVLIGSGSSAENAAALLQHADGIIVDTSLKKDGVMENAMDPHRAKALMDRGRAVRERAAVPADSHSEER
jgi:predicted TIM-barrel enzyme